MFVGLMQVMFGVTWLAAARLSDALRQPLLCMAWFNLLVGASLLLFAQRDAGPYFLTHTAVDLLQLVGFVQLWRAAAGLTGAPVSLQEQRLHLLVAGAAVLLLGQSPAAEQERIAVCYLANAWVLVRLVPQASRQLRERGSTWLVLLIQILGAMAATALAVRALAGLALGADVDLQFKGRVALAWALLLPIFMVNMAVAYQAFGQVVQDANRLSRANTLTGLADDATLTAALVHAWRRFVQWQRPVALLELSLDQLAALRESFGSDTADAVLAELSWKLKLALRPGDLPAHGGDGVFRVLLPDTAPAVARALAQQLLHPDFGQRVTLSAGLAQAGDGDRGAATLGLRARAQRLCAQHAGGDQLVADEVVLTTPSRSMPLAVR
jgi:GGDEF domain-containing protein